MKIADIRKMKKSHYRCNVSLDYLEHHLEGWNERHMGLNLDPDFQREHVWTDEQASKFVEWVLRGGESGREIYFNHPYWGGFQKDAVIELVDGKQRLHALLRFIRNELPAFGTLLKDFDNPERLLRGEDIIFNVMKFKDRSELYRWYIDMNTGGTMHTDAEIDKVVALMEDGNV